MQKCLCGKLLKLMKKSLTKKVSHNIEKILIKVSQKGEKIAYLHKSVILIFYYI